MKPETALIGRLKCGGIVAVDLDDCPEKRADIAKAKGSV